MNALIRLFAACAMVDAISLLHAAPASLDISGFGGGTGKAVTSVSAQTDTANALLIQPDGKLVVAGHCGNNLTSNSFCVARFLSTGGLDGSFGVSGVATTAPGNGLNLAFAAALQPDGKIVVTGACDIDPSSTVTTFAFCVARFNGDGSLDTTGFGTGGHAITTFGSSSTSATARALALQPDGKLLSPEIVLFHRTSGFASRATTPMAVLIQRVSAAAARSTSRLAATRKRRRLRFNQTATLSRRVRV